MFYLGDIFFIPLLCLFLFGLFKPQHKGATGRDTQNPNFCAQALNRSKAS